MSWTTRIYVALLDEGTPCWRPVEAERVGETVYLILDQHYDREDERWQFEPGDAVECEYIETSGKQRILAATRKADPEK